MTGNFTIFPEKRISGGLYYVLLLIKAVRMQISSVFAHKIYRKGNIDTFYHCDCNLTKHKIDLN